MIIETTEHVDVLELSLNINNLDFIAPASFSYTMDINFLERPFMHKVK